MPTDIAFRLSTYVTLALACMTLGYAEWNLLPEASICAFIVAGLLILTFMQEGKLELSLAAANRLGLVIGIIAAAWIVFQIVRPAGGLIYRLPWPASLLPYIGPLIMILMPAKLFRPKHVGDWWTMHGVGLAAVALACTLEDDLALGILVASYFACGAWSLSLFYLRRAAGGVPLIPGRVSNEPRSLVVTGDFSTSPKTLLGRAFAARPLWTLATGAVFASLLFFLTPRIEGPTWNLTTSREVGYSGEDSAPDLNRGGSLATQNREIAFFVTATNPDGSRKTDLQANQLWRGQSFIEYKAGKWMQMPSYQRALVYRPARGNSEIDRDQDGIWIADFEWKTRRKDGILASPVYWQPDYLPPVWSSIGSNRMIWSANADGGGFIHAQREWLQRYTQICRTPNEPNMGPLFELIRTSEFRFEIDPYRDFGPLVVCEIRSIRDYSQAVLKQLIESEKLDKGILNRLDPASRLAAVEDHEAISTAFRDFIANSGEFTYDAKARIPVKDRDPIEDFLLKSKTGTCEQFATGLCLMLRSMGIPCRIVIGFRGCEYDEEAQRYIVRQEMAHAWCEMLTRRKTPANYSTNVNPRPRHVFAWRNLDPTPGDGLEGDSANSIADSVQSYWQRMGDWFSSFISKYDPEQRARLWRNTVAAFKKWWPGVLEIIAVVIVSLGIFRILKRAKLNRKASPVNATSTVPDWYTSFLEIAQSRGVPRLPSETPIEHARRFSQSLPDNLTGLPRQIAECVTAIRYGLVVNDDSSMSGLVKELKL